MTGNQNLPRLHSRIRVPYFDPAAAISSPMQMAD
jgi:hypothetical protein